MPFSMAAIHLLLLLHWEREQHQEQLQLHQQEPHQQI
jgi:hypothetical protein